MPGFNPKAHTATKVAAANRPQLREGFDTQLGEMIAQLKQFLAENAGNSSDASHAGVSTSDSLLTVARQSRRVEVPTTGLFNPSAMQKLNDLLVAESDVLYFSQKHAVAQMLEVNKPGNSSTPEQIVAGLQAMQTPIRCKVDETIRRTMTSVGVGSALTAGIFEAEEEALLEDWIRVCKKPNDAEMYMLGTYVGRDVWEIYDWFKNKRAETNSVYLYLANTAAKGRAPVLRHAAAIRIQAAFNRLRRNSRDARGSTKPNLKRKEEASPSKGKKRKATTPLETIVEEMD